MKNYNIYILITYFKVRVKFLIVRIFYNAADKLFIFADVA